MAQRDKSSATEAWLRLERAEKMPEIIARQILKEIIRRDLSTGDMLPTEASMVEQFGVGRSSLREGLRILEILGLIRIKAGPHGGPVVLDASPSEFGRMTSLFLFRSGAVYRDLLEARLVIEPMMARQAAKRLTPETAALLQQVLDEGYAANEADPETWAEITERFHSVIAGMTGNHVLDFYAAALIGIERRRIGPVFAPGDRSETIRAHASIAKAILGQDPALAERLTRRHVAEVAANMEKRHPDKLDERVEWS
jgi:DNA-binding FadR family transcriptional regulator